MNEHERAKLVEALTELGFDDTLSMQFVFGKVRVEFHDHECDHGEELVCSVLLTNAEGVDEELAFHEPDLAVCFAFGVVKTMKMLASGRGDA